MLAQFIEKNKERIELYTRFNIEIEVKMYMAPDVITFFTEPNIEYVKINKTHDNGINKQQHKDEINK